MGSRLGLNAKLYRNSGTYGSPTWVEFKNVVDLTDNDDMEEAEVTTRGSAGIAEFEPTIRTVSLEFQMVSKTGDTDLAAVRSAYSARTSLDMVALDGAIDEVGATGVRARFKVFSFKKGQELKGAQMIDVTMKPCGDTNPPSDFTVSS